MAMKVNNRLFLLAACCLAACQWGKPGKQTHAIVKDTLKYSYKQISKEDSHCSTDTNVMCSGVDIHYPVFAGQQALNDTILKRITAMFPDDTSTKDIEQLSSKFISLSKKDKEDSLAAQAYTLDGYIKVVRQDSSLVILESGLAIYTGGAHEQHFTQYINWDTKKNSKILLNDIFADGYEKPLNEVGEKIFRKDEKLSYNVPLANDYFFPNGKFSLNKNFLITPLGIEFYYNEYEIKPYVAGPTELFIPYSQIKSLLRPNTVVSQYIK
jgi:hypothetical protein